MIAMSFAQVAIVNGQPNPKMMLPEGWQDLPVIVPILVGLACGLVAGLINGALIAYTGIPPFIATLGMMVTARGVARWWSKGEPISFPTEGYAAIGKGMMPVIIFIALAVLFHLILKLHGLRQAHLRHRLERGGGADVGDQGRAAQGHGLHHRRRRSPRSPRSCSRRRT